MNQPYVTLTLASALREMLGVQLYKNNACALLLCIFSILNSNWLQHVHCVCRVYEIQVNKCVFTCVSEMRQIQSTRKF